MGKNILGLDLGTNSIGWALINHDFEKKEGRILGLGSRIIPMTQDIKDDFGKGNSISQTRDRTTFRGTRRLRERHLLRRERLHRVLNVLGFLPKHYSQSIDFDKRIGKFKNETEPKIAWRQKNEGEYEFVFTSSFLEMVEDFKANGWDKPIPYDWTIYYLRKKALSQKISKEELAWIILNFNQKRGYYQLRGEEEEESLNKLVEFHSLKIVDVIADEEVNKKGERWYSLQLENGWVYRRSSKIDLSDWKGLTKDFIVTTELNDDGSVKVDKEGNERRSFRAPSEDDWTLLKKKTEKDIESKNQTVGTYIYENLLKNPSQKIRGQLVRAIERKFYREELIAILKKQIELQPELFDDGRYNDCIRELYRNNEEHQFQLSKRNFVHLFVDDIIFYQRPLKSQKSTITNCSLEYHIYKVTDVKGNSVEKRQYLKAIPKSHPLYQEFRVWQWMYNFRIYRKDDNADITDEYLNSVQDWENFFDFLMQQKEVNQNDVLAFFLEPKIKTLNPDLKPKALKEKLTQELAKYRWNYVYDEEKNQSKTYPMNETGYEIRRRIANVDGISADFLDREKEIHLWHIIYSVTDKLEFEKALRSYANRYSLDEESFVKSFIKHPPYKSEYGRFSLKAIKKLLALMRSGKYWKWDDIDENTKKRIQKIVDGEFDDKIKDRVRQQAEKHQLKVESDFQGLPLWLAQYVVYDRHSENENQNKWKSPEDIRWFLDSKNPEGFKQHSLRNPIVEQVVTETLRVVADIWDNYGKGEKDFFREIHIELGRDLKNPAEERKRLAQKTDENETTNQRIKALLIELKESTDGNLRVEDVRPHSPSHFEALKLYEEGVLSSATDIPEEYLKISKTAEPTKAELVRYKLWLEQKYRSPYTGEIISLTKLFSAEYEVEHVIPRMRYFDDSLNNKIICESSVNKLKDKQLGLEFIKKHGGEIVIDGDKRYRILTENEYKDLVKEQFSKNSRKRNNLLLEEIPDKMIERQINDTRYISKYICSLLSNIVREEGGKDEEGNSKNLVMGNGKVTAILRKEWGLDNVWNALILPRFERMNQLLNTDTFTSISKEGHIIPTVPFELSKGFEKKRLDHRHHALDALVIACATVNHIQYLNNENAKAQKRHLQFQLAKTLRNTEKVSVDKWIKEGNVWKKTGDKKDKEILSEYIKPWSTFVLDAKQALERVVISFKQNLRVINKTTNKYEKFVEENGRLIKKLVPQTKGDRWAIRKSLHRDTFYGIVHLPWVKVPKGKILTATRKAIDISFNKKTIASITDTGIQKILRNYLYLKAKGSPEVAFSQEGLQELNANIALYNEGKSHQPIKKVRVFELGSKFQLGEAGNKKLKYVEADKGTNLYFAIYEDEKGKRNFGTIPLNIVIERLKQGLSPVPETNEKGHSLLFYLSPNDLVYVPTEEEIYNGLDIDLTEVTKEKAERIYKMVSSSGSQCFFIQHSVATAIVNKVEYSALNKMERSIDGLMIKEICRKVGIDRIGNLNPNSLL